MFTKLTCIVIVVELVIAARAVLVMLAVSSRESGGIFIP